MLTWDTGQQAVEEAQEYLRDQRDEERAGKSRVSCKPGQPSAVAAAMALRHVYGWDVLCFANLLLSVFEL
jgi:hypothetical protein